MESYISDLIAREKKKQEWMLIGGSIWLFLVMPLLIITFYRLSPSFASFALVGLVIGTFLMIGGGVVWFIEKSNRIRKARFGLAIEQKARTRLGEIFGAFNLIHDISLPFGNIDHLVETDLLVLVIETKSWRVLNNERIVQAETQMMKVRPELVGGKPIVRLVFLPNAGDPFLWHRHGDLLFLGLNQMQRFGHFLTESLAAGDLQKVSNPDTMIINYFTKYVEWRTYEPSH